MSEGVGGDTEGCALITSHACHLQVRLLPPPPPRPPPRVTTIAMFRARPALRVLESPFQFRASQRSPVFVRLSPQTRFYQQAPFGRRPQYKRFNASGGISAFLLRWAGRPTFYRDIGLITVGVGGVYVYNLEEVPVSGRRRFNIITPGMEEAMGRASVDQVRQEYQGRILPEYDPRVQKVKKVLQRLLPFAEGEGLKDLAWEVAVIDSPEQNAFVAPGGKVFVFTGILPLCRDEDGIAAVLGHEIAHVVAHHTAYASPTSVISSYSEVGLSWAGKS